MLVTYMNILYTGMLVMVKWTLFNLSIYVSILQCIEAWSVVRGGRRRESSGIQSDVTDCGDLWVSFSERSYILVSGELLALLGLSVLLFLSGA